MVFKTFWRLTKKQIFMILAYLVIFMAMSTMSYLNYGGKIGGKAAAPAENAGSEIPPAGAETAESSAAAEAATKKTAQAILLLVDESGSENAGILARLLENEARVRRVETAAKARDIVISGYSDAMILLPKDFDQRLNEGTDAAEVFSNPQNAGAWKFQATLEKILRFSRASLNNGKIDETLLNSILKEQANLVLPKNQVEAGKWQMIFRQYYLKAASYVVLALILSVFTQLLEGLLRPELENRRLASGFTNLRWQAQILAGLLILGTLLCLILGLGTLIFTGLPEGIEEWVLYAKQLLAVFSLGLSAMSLAWLLLAITRKNSLLSILSNVLSLGLAFLSGSFIDRPLISEGVQQIASLFPPYHYILALENAEQEGSGSYSLQILILLLFALIYLLLASVLRRSRSRSSLAYAPSLSAKS